MSLHHWRGAKPPAQRRHAARVDSVILPPVFLSLPEALAVLGPRTKDEQGSCPHVPHRPANRRSPHSGGAWSCDGEESESSKSPRRGSRPSLRSYCVLPEISPETGRELVLFSKTGVGSQPLLPTSSPQ